tara:strand:- start:2045 stop:2998 length:954 start_codon:yes stop_codon:yes gene_type:complete
MDTQNIPNVLVFGPKSPDILEAISEFANPIAYWLHGSLEACLEACEGNFRAVVNTGEQQVSAELMSRLPALEVISCFGVGYDGVDVGEASRRDIAVTNTPDVLTEDVADLAVGLTLAVRRNIVAAHRYVCDGSWERQGPMALSAQVNGKRVGLVGLGRIGKAIARRLQAFQCILQYYASTEKPELPYRFYSDLVRLAEESDILIVTLPGGANTDKIINREVMLALGNTGCLINVSRGSVIDEDSLIELLETGALGAAGLDVFRNEPHVPEPLKHMQNVVLQPHAGSGTWETRFSMRDLVVENLRCHFKGLPLITPVN